MEIREKNLRRKYWHYIIPSLISQVVFTLYTMVDALMVARGVNANALAGVNIAMPFVTALWAVAIMFAVGTSTIVSRLMGEGKDDTADCVFTETVVVLSIFSIIIGTISFFGADTIAGFLGTTDATREYTVTYIRTVSPFAIAYITSYLFEILCPVDGHPQMASIVVTGGAILNCILDYVFIFIFKWGVWGAAFATGFSQAACSIFFVIHFFGKRANLRFCRFRIDWRLLLQEMKRGLPSGIADASLGIITFVMVYFINRNIGDKGLIANSTISYTAVLVTICAVAIGQGAQPLISYCNGAKRSDLIRRIFRYELKDTAILGVCTISIMFLAAPMIVKFFIPDEPQEVIDYSIHAFRCYMTFGFFGMYNIILSQYSTALERPFTGSLIMLLRASVLLAFGIEIMIHIAGSEGLWFGITVAEGLALIIAIVLYRTNGAYLDKTENTVSTEI